MSRQSDASLGGKVAAEYPGRRGEPASCVWMTESLDD
jgi:hypothetical protein